MRKEQQEKENHFEQARRVTIQYYDGSKVIGYIYGTIGEVEKKIANWQDFKNSLGVFTENFRYPRGVCVGLYLEIDSEYSEEALVSVSVEPIKILGCCATKFNPRAKKVVH